MAQRRVMRDCWSRRLEEVYWSRRERREASWGGITGEQGIQYKYISVLYCMQQSQYVQMDEEIPLDRMHTLLDPSNYQDSLIPGRQDLADLHRLATQTGPALKTAGKLCPCCQQGILRERLSMWCPLEKLDFLGPGYHLFLVSLKAVCLLLLTITVYTGIYSLLIYSGGHSSSWVTYASMLALPTSHHLFLQSVFSLLTVLVAIAFLCFFRLHARKVQNACDAKESTCQDYSVLVEGLPKGQDGAQVETALTGLLERMGMQVCQVSMVYETSRLQESERSIETHLTAMKTLYLRLHQKSHRPQDVLDGKQRAQLKEAYRQESLSVEQLRLSQQAIRDSIMTHCFSGVALVTLYSEQQKNQLLTLCPGRITASSSRTFPDGYHDSVKSIVLSGQLLKISEAPEPQQIDWHNLGSTKSCLGWLWVLLVTLFVVGQDILVISLLDTFYSRDTSKTHLVNGLSLLAGILLYLLCHGVYQRLVTHCVLSQRHALHTDRQVALARSLTLLYFANNCLGLLVGLLIVNPSKMYPLVVTQYLICLLHMILPSLQSLLDLPNCHRAETLLQISRGDKVVTQKELNSASEYAQHQIGERYGLVMSMLFTTCLYATLVPLVLLFGLLGGLFLYLAEKRAILYRRTITHRVSFSLAVKMIDLMEWSLFLFAAGHLLFVYLLYSTVSPLQVLTLCIAALFSVLPNHIISQTAFPRHSPDETLPFPSCNIAPTYHSLNPFSQGVPAQKLQAESQLKRNIPLIPQTWS